MQQSLLPLLISIAFVIAPGCGKQAPPEADAGIGTTLGGGTVTFEFDLGDRTETIAVDQVQPGESLEAVMRSMDQIPITINGSGTTAFVHQIGDVATSSSEGWTFKVDGEFANQGIGNTELHPPTTVSWSFGDEAEF